MAPRTTPWGPPHFRPPLESQNHRHHPPRRRLPLLTQSTEVAGYRGRGPSPTEHAERLLPAGRWNLPQLPGPRPAGMPEQGEFQARPRPLPAGPCPSGHFRQRAARRRVASPGWRMGGKQEHQNPHEPPPLSRALLELLDTERPWPGPAVQEPTGLSGRLCGMPPKPLRSSSEVLWP